MAAPRARTCAETARLASGLTVLMSTTTLPGPSPASRPSGPSTTALSAFVSVTMTKVTSAAAATARGVSPHCMPLSSSHWAFAFVRL
ncbi:hypothetical protein D3C83_40950 [compost metagenome]